MKTKLFAALTLCFALQASAQDFVGPMAPVPEVKGIQLGVHTMTKAAEMGRMYCNTHPVFMYGCVLYDAWPWGPTKGNMQFSAVSETEPIGRISVSFDSQDFKQVTDALITKYGKPNTVETEVVTNGMGVKFENVKMQWKFPNSIITADRFSSSITKSRVSMMTLDYMKISMEKMQEAKAKAAKEL